MASTSIMWWSPDQVSQWLKDNGFEKYVDFFAEQGMTGENMLGLNTEHMFYLVKVFDDIFKMSDVLRLQQCLANLKELQAAEGNVFFATPNPTPPTSGFVSQDPNWSQGGFIENVHAMEGAYPDHCWRYKAVEVLCKDFIPSSNGEPPESYLTMAFPAYVSHVISPVDFFVQPSISQSILRKLQDYLQDIYSDSTSAIPHENIYIGMPCVTRFKEDGLWYRAVVVDAIGADEAPVRFVDYGNRQYSNLADIKPLTAECGRWPPMALQCRIKGVRERTLEQKVLETFHNEIENLGCEVLIGITSLEPSDPFLVEIFNKYTKENIGLKYLPKEPICPKLPPPNVWRKKKDRAMDGESSGAGATGSGETGETKVYVCDMDAILDGACDSFSSSDDQEVGEIRRTNKKIRKYRHEEKLAAQRKWPPKPNEDDDRFRIVNLPNTDISFQRRLRKQRKPFAGKIESRIGHVESAKEIYIRILALDESVVDIERSLVELYNDPTRQVSSLPAEYISPENACVVYDPIDEAWYRCRIVEIKSDGGVVLQAVDIGKRLQVVPPTEYARLKVLLTGSSLDTPPQTYTCRINELCERLSSPTENGLVQDLLAVGQVMKAEFERSREPWRVKLWYPDTGKSFIECLEQEIDNRGLRDIITMETRPCTDLALWKPKQPPSVQVELESPLAEIRRTLAMEKEKFLVNYQKLVQNTENPAAAISGATATVAATPGVGASSMDAVASASGESDKVKPPTPFGGRPLNDIDAVLLGMPDESDEEPVQVVTTIGRNGRSVKRIIKRVTDVEESDRDEKGSVCDFTEEKKEFVSKWLANNTDKATGGKKLTPASTYNPDLTRRRVPPTPPPLSTRSVSALSTIEPTSSGGGQVGADSVNVAKSESKVRVPITSAQMLQQLYTSGSTR